MTVDEAVKTIRAALVAEYNRRMAGTGLNELDAKFRAFEVRLNRLDDALDPRAEEYAEQSRKESEWDWLVTLNNCDTPEEVAEVQAAYRACHPKD